MLANLNIWGICYCSTPFLILVILSILEKMGKLKM